MWSQQVLTRHPIILTKIDNTTKNLDFLWFQAKLAQTLHPDSLIDLWKLLKIEEMVSILNSE